MTYKRLPFYGVAALCLIALAHPAAALDNDPATRTVIWAAPQDPYVDLAREISRVDGLPLADTLDAALAHDPAVLIWVVSPDRLSEERFSDLGAALRRHGKAVSMGLISGGTIEAARALWKRRPEDTGRYVSIVPREGRIDVLEGGQIVHRSLTLKEVVTQLEAGSTGQPTGYVMFQGHGTRRYWRLDETIKLAAADLPALSPIVVAAGACQTFKLWSEDSIALAFTDRGAAAYVGFVHSPHGYLLGDPKGFPFRYTWPEFPLGHAVQVQNRGLQQGFLAWPYYLIVGDPRLALQAGPPYHVQGDETMENGRVLTFTAAPEGVIPVRVPGGAAYRFVDVPGVGRAGQGDPFYSARIQMADIGADKYLLFAHTGGDFAVRLYRAPPWYWTVLRAVSAALDHVTVIQHAQGSLAPGWIASGVLVGIVAWVYWRRKPPLARSLLPALAVGLLLTVLRGGYALARRVYLTTLYAPWLRTMDEAFEISAGFLIPTFVMAAGGAWLFLNARTRWGRSGAFLAILFPNWMMAAFWLGSSATINVLARRRYGFPLYGYGGGLMPLIACAVEGCLIALALWNAGRLCLWSVSGEADRATAAMRLAKTRFERPC